MKQFSKILTASGFSAVLGSVGIGLVGHAAAAYRSIPSAVTAVKSASIPQAQTLDALNAALSVNVSVEPSAIMSNVSWKLVDANDPELKAFLPVLLSEWSKYPAAVPHQTGLQHIYLVKDLVVDGQARSGMPDGAETHALYFDISSKYVDSQDGQYIRRVIHHEFDHYIEYALHQTYTYNDAAWKACNTASFHYGNGGASDYDKPEFANSFHPDRGFVTGYAESAIEEDKAETFAWIMTNPAMLTTLAQSDPILQCKLEVYKPLLTALALPV